MLRFALEVVSVMAFVVALQAPLTVMLQSKHEWMIVRREDVEVDDEESGPDGGFKIVRAPSAPIACSGLLFFVLEDGKYFC